MLQGVWPEILPVGPSQNESQHLLYSLPAKVHIVKAMGFPVVMNGFEKWTIKRDHQRIDASVLWCWRRLLKSPLDCKEIKPVNPKGNQPQIFTGRTDAAAKAPRLWPPDAKS